MTEQYLIKGDVLSKIQNDSSRSLLTLDGCDPASAKAFEDSYQVGLALHACTFQTLSAKHAPFRTDVVIQLVATFASEPRLKDEVCLCSASKEKQPLFVQTSDFMAQL